MIISLHCSLLLRSPILLAWAMWLLISCGSSMAQEKTPAIDHHAFSELWYQGKAEITAYELKQARYGEVHTGRATTIFVTEDFSKKKQVKVDNSDPKDRDQLSVLKMNHNRSFNTGIYPYSMMTSIFTPIQQENNPYALKATTSSQEWCGHTYMQFNLDQNIYKSIGHSYFESEGERNEKVELAFLEDQLWAQIRIDPSALPIGHVEIIPSQIYLRLRHTPIKAYTAKAKLETREAKPSEWAYVLDYEGIDRELEIYFDKSFPYSINGWVERYTSGFGTYAEIKETRATKVNRLWTDYWRQNSVSDYPKYEALFNGSQN